MHKTTVYLGEGEAEGLRRLAAETGRSQAELIREGVQRVLGGDRKRTFHSMGRGRGPGGENPRWDPQAVHDKAFGKR